MAPFPGPKWGNRSTAALPHGFPAVDRLRLPFEPESR